MCDWLRITFLVLPCLSLLANVTHPLSIQSKENRKFSRFLEPLSAEEADKQIALLRSHQLIESSEISFDFIHQTGGSLEPIKTQGILLVGSANQAIFKRLLLIDENKNISVDYIFRESAVSEAWKRLGSERTFTLMSEDEMFSPLAKNILFRPVDVLMPYINWDEYSYEGPQAFGVRSLVQNYLFSAESTPAFLSRGISSVRLSIDSKYNSVRKIEYLNDQDVINELIISGVKKINNLWIISRLIFKEKNSKTIFKVNEVSAFSEDNILHYFDPSNKKKISIDLFFNKR